MSETKFVEIGSKKIQLTVGGSGPPLVYFHSAGGETDWFPFAEQLAQHYTVYLPAHPGFALSTGLDEIRDIYDYAWHYIDLFEQLGLTSVPVVGLSLGAWLACELAILRPERVSKLVLVNAAGLHVPGSPMAELFIDDLAKLRALLFHDVDSPGVKLLIPDSIEDPRVLMWLRAREATARVGWNPYLHNPRLPPHLHRIKHPTLVLWGRHDRLIPLRHGEEYARQLPNARLEIIEDCGHMPPFEKPAEFAAAVHRFVG
ncbi:MAG: alpha/beta hydrolase [Pirellulales bacterium]